MFYQCFSWFFITCHNTWSPLFKTYDGSKISKLVTLINFIYIYFVTNKVKYLLVMFPFHICPNLSKNVASLHCIKVPTWTNLGNFVLIQHEHKLAIIKKHNAAPKFPSCDLVFQTRDHQCCTHCVRVVYLLLSCCIIAC